MSLFYEFDQNNSGGNFKINDERGIGPIVWIEAVDYAHAIARAESIGIYFDGVASGIDCGCCGDRWYPPLDDDAMPAVEIDPKYDFHWHDTVYVHRLGGTIERITKTTAEAPDA